MRYVLLLFVLLTIGAQSAQASRKIETTEDLLRAMQKKYAKSWYKNVTFVQKTTEYNPDGTSKTSIWYEALAMPGRLRIDFTPVRDGNGILFANDTIYSFKDGKLEKSQPFMHPLLILGFDVYAAPVQETMAKLTKLKFDLSIIREDTWQGKPVYVVGARAGDLHSAQFWIDKERLYFVRMLKPGGRDGKQTQETQFNQYQKVKGGGWIAVEVVFMVDGKRAVLEEYSEIRGNVALDEKLFDPQYWTTAHWR